MLDNDAHWYLIKADEEVEFEMWVADTCNGDSDDSPFDFNNDRLSGSPSNLTFTDPNED